MTFDRSLLTFNPNNHGHYYDGKRLLGVTTALSAISKGDGLIQWAVNQAIVYARENLSNFESDSYDMFPDNQCAFGDKVNVIRPEELETILLGAKVAWKAKRDEAASIGTIAHDWVERYLKGEDPEWPDNEFAKRSCEAAVEWIRSVEWETVKVEHQIYIPELGVGGICDWYARINGVLAVPDWKTSKSLHPSYAYQTAAYLKALEGEFGEEIPHRWLIRIDKETGAVEPRFLPQSDIEKDYDTFKSAVTIYRREAELNRLWQS